MDSDPHVIKVKPGNGKLFVGVNDLFVELPSAKQFTQSSAQEWVEEQEDPWGFTLVNLQSGKENSYPWTL